VRVWTLRRVVQNAGPGLSSSFALQQELILSLLQNCFCRRELIHQLSIIWSAPVRTPLLRRSFARALARTWEEQVISARGFKRVGRHSEYTPHTRCGSAKEEAQGVQGFK
jgi:hypothetical protein